MPPDLPALVTQLLDALANTEPHTRDVAIQNWLDGLDCPEDGRGAVWRELQAVCEAVAWEPRIPT